ncbi:hypothetical protein Tco_0625016 [Tanacetum coccineum]|uniref:Uncharacterized protein n=1 Tax=Tanacetum coccineum TaxID=301880 RepID=A0ABQ4WFK5_9ASTR
MTITVLPGYSWRRTLFGNGSDYYFALQAWCSWRGDIGLVGDRMERAATAASLLRSSKQASRISSSHLMTQTTFSTPYKHSITPTIYPYSYPVTEEAALNAHVITSPKSSLSWTCVKGQFNHLYELMDLCTSLSKKGRSQSRQLRQARLGGVAPSCNPFDDEGSCGRSFQSGECSLRRRSVENVQTYIRRRREVSTGSGGTIPCSQNLDLSCGCKTSSEEHVSIYENHGSEIEKEVMKRSGFDLQQESSKPVEEEIVQQKKQVNIKSLTTKYPIVEWETQILANDQYYYQIKRADGSVKHYKIFSAMLYDFDRQDVLKLYRLVKERFQTTSPEGYDLLLWGDLKTLIEPNEEDEIWRNQQDWNLIN